MSQSPTRGHRGPGPGFAGLLHALANEHQAEVARSAAALAALRAENAALAAEVQRLSSLSATHHWGGASIKEEGEREAADFPSDGKEPHPRHHAPFRFHLPAAAANAESKHGSEVITFRRRCGAAEAGTGVLTLLEGGGSPLCSQVAAPIRPSIHIGDSESHCSEEAHTPRGGHAGQKRASRDISSASQPGWSSQRRGAFAVHKKSVSLGDFASDRTSGSLPSHPTLAESVASTLRRRRVLSPNGNFMTVWRPVLLAAVLFAISMAPVDLAFIWWKYPFWYKHLCKVLDVFFLLDMLLHFNTGIIHEHKLVTSRREIALHYLKTYFFIDVVANAPVDWFLTGRASKSRKFVKLSKLPKLLRLLKLFRTLKDQTPYLGVWSALAGVGLVAHYYSCAWAYTLVSDCVDLDEDHEQCPDPTATYLEGLSVSLSGLSGTDPWTRLSASSGSGGLTSLRHDNQQNTPWEDLLAISMTFVGFLLLAILFANMAAAIANRYAVARMRAKMLRRRQKEMKATHVPQALQKKVVATYQHLWRFGGDDCDGMLKDSILSLDLRRNLADHVYGPALRKVPLLSHIPAQCMKCLAQKVEMRLYTPGDLLVLIGEIGTELFVIHSGTVQPIDEHDQPLRDVVLCEGSFFGEICFLRPGSRRTASIVCLEFCKALVLTIGTFKELGMTYLLKAIRKEAKKLEMEYVTFGGLPAPDERLSRNTSAEQEGGGRKACGEGGPAAAVADGGTAACQQYTLPVHP